MDANHSCGQEGFVNGICVPLERSFKWLLCWPEPELVLKFV